MHPFRAASVVALLLGSLPALSAPPPVPDERAPRPGEWGFRPFDGFAVSRNPPAFVWRPQKDAVSYELEIARAGGAPGAVVCRDLPFNACCPTGALAAGTWSWRFRFATRTGATSGWSRARRFTLEDSAVVFPMPPREVLLARVPAAHPRLLVRPEQIPALRAAAAAARAADFAVLTTRCERLLRKPPASAEPPKYPEGMDRESDEWMKIWWGNREATIALLDGAATLAFTRMLGGREEYGRTARRWLMDAAAWDPKGSTGFRYNDEAGMPFAYYFARTYTFVNDLLTEEDRAKCRETVRVRGAEMYRHLCPRQLWEPYESHANRGWHKLGEAAIAFLGEIPEASDWLWFVMHKQFCTYPVWNDDDGGWHEGSSYWSSYIGRFSWWADVMRTATGIDAFRLPYFSRVGNYPMVLMPPGAPAGGMGDLCDRRPGDGIGELAADFASATGNPYWRWYAEQTGAGGRESSKRIASGVGPYIQFLRGARPPVAARRPTDLPSSVVFRGVGQAVLNTDLTHATNNVELVFKSSPFGTHSHGYDANNSFLLYAYGERLLIPTGRRDQYGSAHHRNWMWETKSVNSLTLDGGQGQGKRTLAARGRITGFATSPDLDYVAGDAAEAYEGRLDAFDRHIAFVKPDLIVVYDRVAAPKPASFEWRLHAPVEMKVASQKAIDVVNGPAACRVSFLLPGGLAVSQTDKFDVPPRPKIQLREWHLTAVPGKAATEREFVTVIRPYRTGTPVPAVAELGRDGEAWTVTAATPAGRARVTLSGGADAVRVRLQDRDGTTVREFASSSAAIVPAPAIPPPETAPAK
ncbi:MAG: DUF4962 domain-containing protein [Lentisphaerae bacterium]|nr:DUF4962 domain-containing protein [Lentisphaerota bacterium]